MQGPFTRGEEDIKVKDLVSDLGWDWGKIYITLPSQIVMEIRAMPHSCIASTEDRLIWAATSNGQFNLSNAYLLTIQKLKPHHSFNGIWVWKLNVLPRVQFFIWMCLHNSIATRECLAARGIPVNTFCPICHQALETIIHLLRDCSFAVNYWQNLGANSRADSFSMNLQDWLKFHCKVNTKYGSMGIPWNMIFAFGVWIIWQHRNRVVF